MGSEDLIRLDPDDEPEVFCRKLASMPPERLAEDAKRFEKYGRYADLLNFHRAARRRPETNVSLTYNDVHGWHASSCMKSLPLYSDEDSDYREPCTCERDFSDPEAFFYEVEQDLRKTFRCKLCKRFVPEDEG